jgi:hypothetical protein
MDFSLCPYKNLGGKPKEGHSKYRILDISIVDTVGTIIIAYFISKYYNQDFKMIVVILFILGIILHRLFCVRTTIDKLLFM